MADSCVNCQTTFEKRLKGYKRQKTNQVVGEQPVYLRLSKTYGISCTPDDFLCQACFTNFQKAAKSEAAFVKSGKRKRITHLQKRQKTTTEYGKQERGTRTHSTTRIAKLKQQIKSAIDGSRYITALNHINRIGTGKSALQKFVKLQVRCQARRYVQEETQMSAPVSQKTIQNFSWRRITEEIEAKMPLLHACLAGAVTRWNNEQLFLELTDAKSGCAIPVIGMATAMLLHRRNQQKVHFLQDICSLEMWSSGSGQKLFQCFQKFSISKGIKGTLSCVDRLAKEFDIEVNEWKSNIEAQMKTEFLEQPSYTAVPYNQQADYSPMDQYNCEESSSQSALVPADYSPMDQYNCEENPSQSALVPASPPMDPYSDEDEIPFATAMTLASPPMYPYSDREVPNGTAMDLSSPPMDPYSDDDETVFGTTISQNPDVETTTIRAPLQESGMLSQKCEKDENPGYSLVWDNVQILSTARHQSVGNQNKMLMWALCFAANNRICCTDLDDVTTFRAQDMSLETFLPDEADYQMLKTRMTHVVTRLLKQHLSAFRECLTEDHMTHQYTHEASKKSRIINLGVIESNPSSTAGVINILEILHKYVPKHNNKIWKIPVNGDGLSVERMRDAKLARAGADTAEGRFDGLEPVPQEFHKRAILMQDIFDQLYTGRSGADRGTLYHIRNRFNHRNVTNKVIQTFNYNSDLLQFTTEGLTTLLAMKICGIENQDDIPPDFPTSAESCTALLQQVAKKVVDMVWRQYSKQEIASVIDANDDGVYDEPETDEEDLDSDRPSYEGRWKHNYDHNYSAVREDHVLNYSQALLYHGLKDLAEKDCVRENDGFNMAINWKINMPEFWNNKHNKYLIIGHKLLADIQGFQTQRLGHEIVWNRTANLTGGEGHNLPLDLVNEFLNRDFKENLKRSNGRYTPKQIERTSHFLGTISRDLDKAFQTKVTTAWSASSGCQEHVSTDVHEFVSEYWPDNLFAFIPGREHSAFTGFSDNMSITNPAGFRQRLNKYSVKLDMSREILPI